MLFTNAPEPFYLAIKWYVNLWDYGTNSDDIFGITI